MRHLRHLARPDDKLRRIRKVAARDIGRRIRFGPRHHIQNLKAQLRKSIRHTEDIMIRTTHPNGAIILQLIATKSYPLPIESLHILWCTPFIPLALVYTHHLASLTRNAPVTQEIGRIGKNHVELKTERRQQLECVAVKKGKIAVGRFIIRLYHSLLQSFDKIVYISQIIYVRNNMIRFL